MQKEVLGSLGLGRRKGGRRRSKELSSLPFPSDQSHVSPPNPPPSSSSLVSLMGELSSLRAACKEKAREVALLDEACGDSDRLLASLLPREDSVTFESLKRDLILSIEMYERKVDRNKDRLGSYGLTWVGIPPSSPSSIATIDFDLLVAKIKAWNHRITHARQGHNPSIFERKSMSSSVVSFVPPAPPSRVLLILRRDGLLLRRGPPKPFFSPPLTNLPSPKRTIDMPATGLRAYQDLVSGFLPSCLQTSYPEGHVLFDLQDERERSFFSSTTCSDEYQPPILPKEHLLEQMRRTVLTKEGVLERPREWLERALSGGMEEEEHVSTEEDEVSKRERRLRAVLSRCKEDESKEEKEESRFLRQGPSQRHAGHLQDGTTSVDSCSSSERVIRLRVVDGREGRSQVIKVTSRFTLRELEEKIKRIFELSRPFRLLTAHPRKVLENEYEGIGNLGLVEDTKLLLERLE